MTCTLCLNGIPHPVASCTDALNPKATSTLPGEDRPACEKCDRREAHTRKDCRDVTNWKHCVSCVNLDLHVGCPNDEVIGGTVVIEGTGIITRIDRYILSVDGHHIRATEDQEARIRVLTREQRRNLLKILGLVKTDDVAVAADPAVGNEVTFEMWACRCGGVFQTYEGLTQHKHDDGPVYHTEPDSNAASNRTMFSTVQRRSNLTPEVIRSLYDMRHNVNCRCPVCL